MTDRVTHQLTRPPLTDALRSVLSARVADESRGRHLALLADVIPMPRRSPEAEPPEPGPAAA